MRNFLLVLTFLCGLAGFAQAPTIECDLMLCPYTNGTAEITNNQTYETYQWYYKYWFLNGEYEAIDGATSASFTYDWMTYDQALLKVVVTLNGQEYESNVLQVDSYAWTGLLVESSWTENEAYIHPDNGHFMICPGSSITNTVGSPYTNFQWYKDGEPIEGATQGTYLFTEAGTYNVVAAPESCPNSTSSSPDMIVELREDCTGDIAPVIIGDLMMCPWTEGTAFVSNHQGYETYQWYYKYWFLNDDYVAIEGATSANFTYDWYTYDQALLKLVTTRNGQTFESNVIQIDSYNWVGLLVESSYDEEQVYIHPDNGHFMMCPGSSITNSVGSPYISFQWYKDGEPIEGATQSTYVFTEPGAYRVVASPDVCPDSTTTGPEMIVELRDDCTAGTENPELKNNITLYPNPANSVLNVQLGNNVSAEGYAIYDVTGKQLTTGSLNGNLSSINIEGLATGSYLIKINGANGQATKLFVKQ